MVWGFGRPEQLLDIGDTRLKLLVESAEGQVERARRDVGVAREDKGTDPQTLAAMETKLLELEGERASLARLWAVQIRQARRDEFAYILAAAVVGACGLWAGCIQLRDRSGRT